MMFPVTGRVIQIYLAWSWHSFCQYECKSMNVKLKFALAHKVSQYGCTLYVMHHTAAELSTIFDVLTITCIAAGCDDSDPYWTRVWPSAVALAHQLLKRPELVRGATVADLGSGLGVAGLAAALAGTEQRRGSRHHAIRC